MGRVDTIVVHVLASDVSAAKLDTLQAMLAAPQVADRQELVHVGGGPLAPPFATRTRRATAAIPVALLQRYALVRTLSRLRLRADRHRLICHAWSPTAARWCLPLAAPHRPVLLEVDAWLLDRHDARRPIRPDVICVCPSLTVQNHLRRRGLPLQRCPLIRPAVAADALRPELRPLVRAQLELAADDIAILLVPPITRAAGALTATWAALLVEKARPDVRLIVPTGSGESERIRRLVASCQHEHVARFADPRSGLRELLAAADLAVFAPPQAAPTADLAWALAAGCPVVATDVPTVTELLQHGRDAWLCRPHDPRDAARWMLRAIESPDQSRRQAAQARAVALARFSRSRIIAEYQRLYAALTSGQFADIPAYLNA